jgi:hypothetical protein
MAESFYKLVGTNSPHIDWTSEVVLERDEDGNVTKSIKAGVPVQLSADEVKSLSSEYNLVFEKSSKEEADQAATVSAAASVGSDVAGSAPLFGESTAPNQAANDQTAESSGGKK